MFCQSGLTAILVGADRSVYDVEHPKSNDAHLSRQARPFNAFAQMDRRSQDITD